MGSKSKLDDRGRGKEIVDLRCGGGNGGVKEVLLRWVHLRFSKTILPIPSLVTDKQGITYGRVSLANTHKLCYGIFAI
ncbi:MAG: hypothetical protein A2542_03455 [Parcubacteria group bacterium RIFOXYD2_FULL_52_8]|nr:MAG: hypothetical protein A2542_03455 [Parcubacteria group bacterium RIFOXYD2_FULL_52_8]